MCVKIGQNAVKIGSTCDRVALNRGGVVVTTPTKIFVGQQKKYLRAFFYPLGSAVSKMANFFFWSDVDMGWFSLLTKKTYFFKAKTEFFTQNGLFQGVFKGSIGPPKYRKNHVLPLWKCPLFVYTIGNVCPKVFCGRTHPREPKQAPGDAIWSRVRCTRMLFLKITENGTLGRLGSF